MTTLTKICNHWTAGNYEPCPQDLNSYHYLINDKGYIYLGAYTPEDNINCKDGKYAQHCGGGNTNCIGISACGMVGYSQKDKYSKCPLTKKQIENLCCLNAYLSLKYKIPVNNKTIFTHYEFDHCRQKKLRKGKIDITYIHYLPNLTPDSIGKYLRQKISWYREKIKLGKYTFTKKGDYYEFIVKS